MFVCIPETEGYDKYCVTQCSACMAYEYGYTKPYYPVPAIPLKVEYSPWTCVHGHKHIMISITEIRRYEDTNEAGVPMSGSLWNTVELW